MSRETFDKLFLRYNEQRINILKELQKYEGAISNLSETLESVVHLCTKLNTVWASGDLAMKEDLQELIFPKGILYDRKNEAFRTPEVNSVFSEIARLTGNSGENEQGTNHACNDLSLVAGLTIQFSNLFMFDLRRLANLFL